MLMSKGEQMGVIRRLMLIEPMLAFPRREN